MAKVTAAMWPSKLGPDGTAPVYVVIRHGRERAALATPIRVKPRDWNDRTGEVRKTAPDFHASNRYLAERREAATSALLLARLRGDPFPCRSAKEEVEREGGGDDFLAYCRDRLDHYRRRRQWGTHEVYRVVVEKLTDYVRRSTGRRELPVAAVTVRFLEGFQTYLVETHGNGASTVAKNLSTIRTMYYAAIRAGIASQADNPFFRLPLPSSEPSRKRPLTVDEIWRLEDASFARRRMTDARNAFVFAFYEGGVRISDVLQLTTDNVYAEGSVWRVAYEAEKTGKASYMFPLWPSAERILRSYGWPDLPPGRYLFPFLPARVRRGSEEAFVEIKRKTALVNKNLRLVREACGIGVPLTTHIARHTFSHYLDELGWSVQQIQELLRHHDSAETEGYLRSMRTDGFDDRLRPAFTRPR